MSKADLKRKKHKIKIDYTWSDKSSWDYKINLKLKGNNKK